MAQKIEVTKKDSVEVLKAGPPDDLHYALLLMFACTSRAYAEGSMCAQLDAHILRSRASPTLTWTSTWLASLGAGPSGTASPQVGGAPAGRVYVQLDESLTSAGAAEFPWEYSQVEHAFILEVSTMSYAYAASDLGHALHACPTGTCVSLDGCRASSA